MKKFVIALSTLITVAIICTVLVLVERSKPAMTLKIVSHIPYEKDLDLPNCRGYNFVNSFDNGMETEFIQNEGIVLKRSDIKEVKIFKNDWGSPSVNFSLTKSGAELLKEFTSQNMGEKAAFEVNNSIILVAVIRDVIPGGQLQITTSETNLIYHVAKAFGLKNDYELSKKTEIIKQGLLCQKIDNPDFTNPSDVITNFFYGIYNADKKPAYFDYLKKYLKKDAVNSSCFINSTIDDFKETMVSKYRQCKIIIDSSTPLSPEKMQALKENKETLHANCRIIIGDYYYVYACVINLSVSEDGRLYVAGID